jgi:iron(III) transport system substrate-binding protein
MSFRPPLLALLLAALLALAACGSDDDGGGGDGGGASGAGAAETLTVYSGRSEKLVGELYKQFERDTGVKVEVRYGDSAELAATIAEEGENSPADVFFSQDAGALGAVEQAGRLAPLPPATLDKVDEDYRDPNGRWVGAAGRARVVAYSTERVKEADLPDSIFDFTAPEWKGRIGFPPPNASFQAFISGMRLAVGDERTKTWLEEIKANDPVLLENNIQTEEAIAAGEIDVGFVNHYYVFELQGERPDFPVANHFLRDGDPGTLVNVAGAGILAGSENARAAQQLVDYLLSPAGQTYFATQTSEYPLVAGIAPPEGARSLDSVEGPDISLGELGGKLRSTLELLNEVGLTT